MKKNIRSAWSSQLEQDIADTKAKINLRDRDDAAFLCSAREIMQNLETKKTQMKTDISHKRKELARCLNGDKEVIITALNDSPVDQLIYMRGTAEKCIVEKNQDVFDQVKKLNNLKHQINQKQQRMAELELSLSNLKRQEQPQKAITSTDDESEQRIRILSTRLDKVLLKINSARYVNTTYKRLLSYLEKDSLSLPGRLDNLENTLESQKQELIALRKTAKEARIACENTRKSRSKLEHEVMAEKNQRDRKITGIRKNLRQIQDEADQFNVAPLVTRKKDGKNGNKGTDSMNRMTTFNSDRKIQKEALSAALNILQDTVGASKVEDIATNFESQITTQCNLLSEAENLQKKKEELKLKLVTVEASLRSSQFDNKNTFDSNKTENLKKEDFDNINKAKDLEKQLSETDRYIRRISDAINVYYRKACILNGNVDCNESLPYDSKIKLILDQFAGLSEKHSNEQVDSSDDDETLLAQNTLNEMFGNKLNSMHPQQQANININSIEQTAETYQLNTFIPTTNLRIDLPDEEDEANNNNERGSTRGTTNGNEKSLFNDEDEELEVNFFSRDDIKKKANEIINLARPKKGKKGKK